MSYIIPSTGVWEGPENMMNGTPVMRLHNTAKDMKSLITWLGYVRLHFSRQGEIFSCWPWRSKLPYCELPVGEATWQGAKGSFQEPGAVLSNSQQKNEDLNHTASRCWILPTLKWALEAESSLEPPDEKADWPISWEPLRRRPYLDSDWQKLWDND